MKVKPSTTGLRLAAVPIRFGLPLALGTLITLLLIGLIPIDSLSLALGDSSSPGDLDITFGSGGIVTTRISTGPGENAATDVAIQSDGKIVAVGYAPSTTYDFVVVRYTASGTLDTDFGGGGIVTTPIGSGNDYARSVVIQPDGKIVVAGSAYGDSDLDFAVARYTTSGALDTTFGMGGITITPVGVGNDYLQSVAIQPDGKIVVVGSAYNDSDRDIAVLRYTASGMPDSTFGSSGIVTTPIGPGTDNANDLAIQAGGKIVVVGQAHNGVDYDFAVLRYTASGALDSTFGGNGIVTTPIGPGDDFASGLAIQSDSIIVVAGQAHNGSDDDFALVRYTGSGALDTTFGSSGIVTTPIGPGTDYANDLAIQAGGKIVVVGQAHNGVDYDFAVLRYSGSGALDTTFGGTGIVTTPIGLDKDYASGVAIQPDGKIVAAGLTNNGSDDDFALVRYHAGHFIYLPLVLNNDKNR